MLSFFFYEDDFWRALVVATQKKKRDKRDDKKRARRRIFFFSSPFFFSHSLINNQTGLKLKSRNFLFFSFRVSGVEVLRYFHRIYAYGLTQLRRRSPPNEQTRRRWPTKRPRKTKRKATRTSEAHPADSCVTWEITCPTPSAKVNSCPISWIQFYRLILINLT